MADTLSLPPVEQLAARYSRGETFEGMANEFGCSAWSIRKRFKDAGIQSRRRGPADGVMVGRNAIELPESVVGAYNAGQSIPALSRQHGTCVKTIQRFLHKHGAKRGNVRCGVNDAYFNDVQTEAQAYWLGLLMADGCVYDKPGRHGVHLVMKDKEHVELYAATLQTTAKVREIVRNKPDGRILRYYEVFVASRQLVADLAKYGIVPRKTCNHGTPELPTGLLRHFYRGYVDGDGCIRRTRSGSPQLFVTGHRPFLETMQDWLSAEIGQVLNTKIQAAGRAGRLGFGGKEAVALMCAVLYDDCTIALARKQAVAQDISNS